MPGPDLTVEPISRLALLVGAALLASTLAAVTGFGGAAVLLPALVAVFGIRAAVPILAVAQLIGNGSRVLLNRREVNYRIVGWFAIGGVPAAFVGGLLFAAAPTDLLTRLLGAFLLVVVAWRHLHPPLPGALAAPAFTPLGAGFAFLSALLGSVGPLMAPFFLAAGLVKGSYIGTEALATVVMRVATLAAYGSAALLTGSSLLTGLALGPVMILGSIVGKRIVDRLPEQIFVILIEVVLVVAGLGFLIGG